MQFLLIDTEYFCRPSTTKKASTTLFAYPLDFMDFQFQVSLPRVLRFKIARLLGPLVS